MNRILRGLGLVWEAAPGWTVANLALAVAQGLLPAAALWIVKLIVEAVSEAVTSGQGASPEAFQRVTWLLLAGGGIGLARALCQSLSRVATEAQAQLFADRMHEALHAKSVSVDLEFYENPDYYDAFHLAQREAFYRPVSLLNALAGSTRAFLGLTGILWVLATFHWALALLPVIAAAPGVFFRFRRAKELFKWTRRRSPADRQAHYYHQVLTEDEFAKEVRLFDLGSLFSERFRATREVLRGERLALAKRAAWAEWSAQAGGVAAALGAHLWLTSRALAGTITLGDFVMFFYAFGMAAENLRGALLSLVDLWEHQRFLANLFEFLDLEPRVRAPEHPVPVPTPRRDTVAFEDVSFAYAGGKRGEVLRGVSFQIAPGEVVALVGENGAGKSTIVKLLCRLCDPTAGRVSREGTDLRDFDPDAWRREIAVVFQDSSRYCLTVRENIALSESALDLSGERAAEAARQAGAEELAHRLPKGFETMLGKKFEGGEELSIGQWRRIALARAFFRSKAPLVILDEPAAGLDARAEADLFDRLRELLAGRAALFVAHRMASTRSADRVLVLDGGKIVENGPPEELLKRGGLYRELFDLQAERYRREP
jgi:ATP-binding cassette subfamily B protein